MRILIPEYEYHKMTFLRSAVIPATSYRNGLGINCVISLVGVCVYCFWTRLNSLIQECLHLFSIEHCRNLASPYFVIKCSSVEVSLVGRTSFTISSLLEVCNILWTFFENLLEGFHHGVRSCPKWWPSLGIELVNLCPISVARDSRITKHGYGGSIHRKPGSAR